MASKEIKLMQCHRLSVPVELVCQDHSNVIEISAVIRLDKFVDIIK